MFQGLKGKLGSFVGKTKETAEKKADLSATTKIKGILKQKIRLSEGDLENMLWDFQLDLLQSDVAAETAEFIIERLRADLEGKEIEKSKVYESVVESLKSVLREILSSGGQLDLLQFLRDSEKPVTIVFLGVNGVGKTTTIMRLSDILLKNHISVVFAAGDTFRAGAIEQLKIHGANMGVKTIAHQKSSDSAAVIFDAIDHARAKNLEVVLADTAGRMQTKLNLMDEMKKICRVNNPQLKIFVGDALTGNDAVEQAVKFHEAVGIDAVILTKMDADVKGGSALSIAHAINKPIIYVGLGQGAEDLKEFKIDWFISKIFD